MHDSCQSSVKKADFPFDFLYVWRIVITRLLSMKLKNFFLTILKKWV